MEEELIKNEATSVVSTQQVTILKIHFVYHQFNFSSGTEPCACKHENWPLSNGEKLVYFNLSHEVMIE